MRILFFLTSIILISACGAKDGPNNQIANPASKYCEDQGGTVMIKKNDQGEYGVCKLKDGREIEEWEYYRKNNP